MTRMTKIALQERDRTAAIAQGRATRRLTSQWHKDPEGALLIRWGIEATGRAPLARRSCSLTFSSGLALTSRELARRED